MPDQNRKSGDAPARSREETTARIIEAAATLFAERNPNDVTVREIADKAGVTHALVHQYFGTKDDLMRAVFERNSWDFRALARHQDDVRDAVAAIFAEANARRAYSRAFVRSAMDGVPLVELGGSGGTLHELVRLERASIASGRPPAEPCRGVDERVVTAALVAMSMGWIALDDYLIQAMGLEEMDRASILEAMTDMMQCVADFAFPAEGFVAEGDAPDVG